MWVCVNFFFKDILWSLFHKVWFYEAFHFFCIYIFFLGYYSCFFSISRWLTDVSECKQQIYCQHHSQQPHRKTVSQSTIKSREIQIYKPAEEARKAKQFKAAWAFLKEIKVNISEYALLYILHCFDGVRLFFFIPWSSLVHMQSIPPFELSWAHLTVMKLGLACIGCHWEQT